jgi:glycogen debranching enzyme
VRPNQLIAFALPGVLPTESSQPLETASQGAVEVCGRLLLTPLGLRSLAPTDGRYIPLHRGGPAQRDAAYHQGTVWPWLLGPYVDAATRVGAPLAGIFEGVEGHLGEWGLGSISETADGAAPHAASGCPFQAWSVAEVLRVRRLMGGTT